MRELYSGVKEGGESKVVSTVVGCPPFLVDRQSEFGIIAQRGKDECRDEFGVDVVDHVNSNTFGEVNRHGLHAVWGTRLVETPSYSMCEREEGRNGREVGTEAMLDG